MKHTWFVYDQFIEASQAAADFLADKIQASLDQQDVCHVVLPGGNSPAACFGFLLEKNLSWEKCHWYLGDERCYPQGHAERNDVMLQQHFWSHMISTNIHTIPTETGAEQAAKYYRDIIRDVAAFDIAFLGMGEDGHTASLFPGNAALADTRSVIPVYNSPKAPDERVSLSLDTLRKAHCRMVLTGGAAKAEAISHIKSGEPLPVNCVGDINWFIDKAALLAG